MMNFEVEIFLWSNSSSSEKYDSYSEYIGVTLTVSTSGDNLIKNLL